MSEVVDMKARKIKPRRITDSEVQASQELVRLAKSGAPPKHRDGFPVIVDPEHPLWEDQQSGWLNTSPEYAWVAVLELAPKPEMANSKSHPAFAVDYIVNKHATRPLDEPAEEVRDKVLKDRR